MLEPPSGRPRSSRSTRRPATGPARRSPGPCATPRTESGARPCSPCYERGEAEPLAEAAGLLRDEDGQALATAFRALLELPQAGQHAQARPGDRVPGGRAPGQRGGRLVPARARWRRRARRQAPPWSRLVISALRDEREDVSERAEDVLELLAPDSVDALDGRAEGRRRAGTRRGGARADQGRTRARLAGGGTPASRSAECAPRAARRSGSSATRRHPSRSSAATRDSEHLVRAAAGAALDRIGTAAVAVSVASLLRPLLEVTPAELMQALATDDVPLLETNGSERAGRGARNDAAPRGALHRPHRGQARPDARADAASPREAWKGDRAPRDPAPRRLDPHEWLAGDLVPARARGTATARR